MRPSFSIARHELHVWASDLRALGCLDGAYLSRDEQARANAFVFERDRVRYRRGRALLRALLAGYLGVAASALKIASRAHVKPRLEDHEIHFNVSHSADSHVLAISHLDVGVDVELERDVDDALELGRNVFSADENATLCAMPTGDRSNAFLLGWTRKEAFVKALGIGLGGLDLTAITVGLDAGERTIPALHAISDSAIKIRSHRADREFIASACDPSVTDVIVRDLDEAAVRAFVSA